MTVIWQRLKAEPALDVAVAVAAINAVLLLPDWRLALASAGASLTGGVITRQRVKPA